MVRIETASGAALTVTAGHAVSIDGAFVAAHEAAQARLRTLSNRFGAMLARKGEPAAAVSGL